MIGIKNNTFIGVGNNPDGPDLPLGLGMRLGMEPQAMKTFAMMSNGEKEAAINYIQSNKNGTDAKHRIEEVVESLKNGQTQF